MQTWEPGNLFEEVQRLERRARSGGPPDRAALAAWLKRSPQHLQVYLQHFALEAELSGLDSDRELDIDALLRQASSKVIRLPADVRRDVDEAASRRPNRRRWIRYAAAAAITALGVALAVLRFSGTSWTEYATVTGEQRRIALPDGSILDLNTQSHVRVAYNSRSRDIDLISGEALFTVRHQSNRPFRVHASGRIIEDVGTQFCVYVRPDASATISVLDGRVHVLAPGSESTPRSGVTELSAGEGVQIDPGGRKTKRVTVNLDEIAAWREHKLWFDRASLSEVAAEFNRYNRRKIRVSGNPLLSQKRYTATFDAYDPESFVDALRGDPMLTVNTDGQGMRIAPR